MSGWKRQLPRVPLPHRCKPPGSWWKRWRLGVKEGSIWTCPTCRKRHVFWWMDTDLATFAQWSPEGGYSPDHLKGWELRGVVRGSSLAAEDGDA